ncbi:MAG: hypothetical protein NTV83_00540, partial [Aeromonas sp.]|nr:hypothetical protein [Aeromonas sp.]
MFISWRQRRGVEPCIHQGKPIRWRRLCQTSSLRGWNDKGCISHFELFTIAPEPKRVSHGFSKPAQAGKTVSFHKTDERVEMDNPIRVAVMGCNGRMG